MKHTRISSTSNPLVKEAIEIRRREATNRNGLFLIEGPHLVEMALNSGSAIKVAFLTESFSIKDDNQKLLQTISQNALQIVDVPEHVMARLADTRTPQGVVAVVSYKVLKLGEITPGPLPFFAVADGIQDPGNLGTVIRTADASGAGAVIVLPGTCDAFMQKTIRASAGSIFNVPVVRSETSALLKWAADKKIALAVTLPDAGTSVFDVDLVRPIAFVFGSEAHGASEELRQAAEMKVKIPLYGKAESLNVATSAAICLYEAARQRLVCRNK